MHPTWTELVDSLRSDMLQPGVAEQHGLTDCYVDVSMKPSRPWWMEKEDLKLVDLLGTL